MDPTVKQFNDTVLKPTLRRLPYPYAEGTHCGGPVAEPLVLATIVHESEGLEFLHQVKGPALGVANIQQNAWDDMHNRAVQRVNADRGRWRDFWRVLQSYTSERPAGREQLVGNLYLNVAYCRLMYLLATEPLPKFVGARTLARYWHAHFNKGPEDRRVEKINDFVDDFERFIK